MFGQQPFCASGTPSLPPPTSHPSSPAHPPSSRPTNEVGSSRPNGSASWWRSGLGTLKAEDVQPHPRRQRSLSAAPQAVELDELRRLTNDVQVASDQVASAIQRVEVALRESRARAATIRERSTAASRCVLELVAMQDKAARQVLAIAADSQQVR